MNENDRQPLTSESDNNVLTAWKEIASHLQVSIKTAQRYESELGLPVKRVGGRVSLSLFELTQWKEKNTYRNPWWTRTRSLQVALAICGGLAVLGILTISWFVWMQRPGSPASVHMEDSLLTVKDELGRTVWGQRFDYPTLTPEQSFRMPIFLRDIDNDGKLEALLVWQHTQRDLTGWGLHCFSADGKSRWLLKIDDKIRNASGKEFGPPFVIRSFTLFDSPEGDKTQWIAAVFVHVTDVASTLVVVDSRGKRRGQYWHAGHLNSVQMFDASGDGKLKIVAAGVRHGVEQAVLIAFDPANVKGANSMPLDDHQTIVNQGPSSEVLTGYFARSYLAQQLATFNFVTELQLVNGNLRASVYETLQAPEGYLVYEFLPGLKVKGISMSSAYTEADKRLRMKAKLRQLVPDLELARLRDEFRLESHR